MPYLLRFACGARLPREGLLDEPLSEERLCVWVNLPDQHADTPLMPNGQSARCLMACPEPRLGRRRVVRTLADNGTGRVVVTCRPKCVAVGEDGTDDSERRDVSRQVGTREGGERA